MCVGIIKAQNVLMPSDTVIERCFKTNPDGAGFAWFDDEESIFRWKKGFMSLEDFLKAKNEVFAGKDTTKMLVLMHFRIGTHGGKRDPGKTHPFPVCDSYEEMIKLEGSAPAIMMHNGILHDFGHLPQGSSDELRQLDPSDTMIFNAEVLAQVDPLKASSLISRTSRDNRVCYATEQGRGAPGGAFYWGFWQKSDQAPECLFTNLSWQYAKTDAELNEEKAEREERDKQINAYAALDAWNGELFAMDEQVLGKLLRTFSAMTEARKKFFIDMVESGSLHAELQGDPCGAIKLRETVDAAFELTKLEQAKLRAMERGADKQSKDARKKSFKEKDLFPDGCKIKMPSEKKSSEKKPLLKTSPKAWNGW